MMETKLKRITAIARENKGTKFSTLMYLVNEYSLTQCHREMASKKTAGISGETKESYGQNLEENLADLIIRMKRMSYKPQMVKRIYISKEGSQRKRPLGVPEYEDKLVQRAMAKILNTIYEADFLDCSMGFRPNRSQHDALKVLNIYLEKKRINYVVDVDIKGFFDNVNHKWMMEFLGHRISDPKFLRMIARFLKSGYLEDGKHYKTDQGTPQGGVISPILANIYLHYVLDLWFEKVQERCQGDAYMVRFADDFVCCFEHLEEAELFYEALVKRLAKFGLEIAEDKTRILPFGKDQDSHIKSGQSKTFDFLGFTHYCGKGKHGRYRVKRKMSCKKRSSKLKAIKLWVKHNRTQDIRITMKKLNQKLSGLYNYYCITDSSESMSGFYQNIIRILFKWLNRRSQKKSFTWDKFNKFLEKYPVVEPRIKVNIYDLKPEYRYML